MRKQRICLVISILIVAIMLSGCVPSSEPPQEPERPPGLPDLVWAGALTLEPSAPAVGDKLHIKQTWSNAGLAATSSEFDIRLEIRQGNFLLHDQYIRVQQPARPGEERAIDITIDITPEYVIPRFGGYQIILALDAREVIAESSEDNNVIESDILRVSGFSKKVDMAAVAQAKEDIEKYRKGDVTLTIVDAKGQPCSGLAIEYAQTTHSFLFGIYWNIRASDDERVWSLMKEAGFNYIPVTFTWKEVEPEPGTYKLGADWSRLLRQFGFAGMGHCLIFLMQGAPWSTPNYVKDLSYEEYKQAVYPHIHKVVKAFREEIKIWNVFNEPMQAHANILNLTEEQTIEVIREGVRAIRDADPEGRILINNYNPGGERPGMYPFYFLRDAIQADIDFEIIGLEFYYNAPPRHPRRNLSSMGELIDEYSILGKKIQVTEISVPSEAMGEGYWGQPWSQELQAEYLVTAYTIFFSKPQVEAIIWWDATDKPTGYGNPFIYHGALLDEQNRPKKSYYALKDLIKSWMTTGTGVTNGKGQINFRGFGGTYEVTITNPETGLSQKQQITIEEQKDNLITIVLD